MPRLNRVGQICSLSLILAAVGCSGSPDAESRKIPGPEDRARLFEAVAAGDKDAVVELLNRTKAIDIRNESGYSLLHWAVLTKQVGFVTLLISRGGAVNTALPGGRTPLHDAVFTGSKNAVQLLIEHGADVYAMDELGKRPLDTAVELGREELIPLLKPLHEAVERGNRVRVEELIRRSPAGINMADESGASPLHIAAGSGHSVVIEFLVNNGADMDARGPWGKTPLRMAVESGRTKAAAFLRARNALDSSDEILLRKDLAKGQAVIWYLFHTGWAIRTRNHLLIFDYVPMDSFVLPASVPACLSSGGIDPRQIKDQNVVVFVPIVRNEEHINTLLSWKRSVRNISFVLGEDKVEDPASFYIPPRGRKRVDGMDILTIGTTGYGEGFVVHVDGLTIFYAGDHESSEASWDLFTREIDFLEGKTGRIDMAFLQMIFEEQNRSSRGVFYALDKLRPAVMFPNSALAAAPFYESFVREASALKLQTKIKCAARRGDLFDYPGGRGAHSARRRGGDSALELPVPGRKNTPQRANVAGLV